MSEKRPRKHHHIKTWLLSLLAVPVLYVLAFPPLWFEFGWLPYFRSHRMHPEWLGHYRDSYIWIGEHTGLKKPMNAYKDWCIRRMKDARGIKLTPQDASR